MGEETSGVPGAARTVAFVVGIVSLLALASLIVFFIVSGPFGLINDALNALIGILAAALAIVIHRSDGAGVATGAAIIGGAVAVVGSWLVMTGATGFVLAGLVSSVGFGLIGVWLFVANRSDELGAALPAGLRTLGLVAGAAMAFGLVALPGIAMSIDSFDEAPAWLWLYGINWLGTYLLLPAWCLWFGRSAGVRSA